MEEMELSKLIAVLAPFVAVQLILMIIALVLCIRAKETRGPKLMWILIIIFVNILGPFAFFVFGRRNGS
ncbi:PLD nuclease N-terminal domain-containing protein [Paenibacillus sp. strain BS8-2]